VGALWLAKTEISRVAKGFIIAEHRVYPLVGAHIRDFVLKFFRNAENISASRP
jgi:hypothetical protein